MAAAEHLLALGHTRIGFVGGRSAASAERLTGLEARITSATSPASLATHVMPVEPTEEAGAEPSGTCSTPTPDVTAVFAANDVMALGAMSGSPPGACASPRTCR